MALFDINFDLNSSYDVSSLPPLVMKVLDDADYDARVGFRPLTAEQAKWLRAFAVSNKDRYSSEFLEEIRMGFNGKISLEEMKDVVSVFDKGISPSKWRIALLNTLVTNGHSVEEGLSVMLPDLKEDGDYAIREQQVREMIMPEHFFSGRDEKNALGLQVFFMDYALHNSLYKKEMLDAKKIYLQFREEKASEFAEMLDSAEGRERISSILNECASSHNMTDYYKQMAFSCKDKMELLFHPEKDTVLDLDNLDFLMIDYEETLKAGAFNKNVKKTCVLFTSLGNTLENMVLVCYNNTLGEKDFITKDSFAEWFKNFKQQHPKMLLNDSLSLEERIKDFYSRNGEVSFGIEVETAVLPNLQRINEKEFYPLKEEGLVSFGETHKTLEMKFLGKDEWGRPVYECQNNSTLYKDVAMDSSARENVKLFTCSNDFHGEPDCPLRMSNYNITYDMNVQKDMFLCCAKTLVQDSRVTLLKDNFYQCTEVTDNGGSLSYKIRGEDGKELSFDSLEKVQAFFDVSERTDDISFAETHHVSPVTVEMSLSFNGKYSDVPFGEIEGTVTFEEEIRDDTGMIGYSVAHMQYEKVEDVGYKDVDGHDCYLSEYDVIDNVVVPLSYQMYEKASPVKVDLFERQLISHVSQVFETIGFSQSEIDSLVHQDMSERDLEYFSDILQGILLENSLNEHKTLDSSMEREVLSLQHMVDNMLDKREKGNTDKPIPAGKTADKKGERQLSHKKETKEKIRKGGQEH